MQKLAIVMLFLLGQGVTTLHAAKHGSNLHFHNDRACFVAVSEDDYDIPVPASESLSFFVTWKELHPLTAYRSPMLPNRSVRPPKTGPPLYI